LYIAGVEQARREGLSCLSKHTKANYLYSDLHRLHLIGFFILRR